MTAEQIEGLIRANVSTAVPQAVIIRAAVSELIRRLDTPELRTGALGDIAFHSEADRRRERRSIHEADMEKRKAALATLKRTK